MAHLTLITGGARSGKSAQALTLARACRGPRAFVATAEPLDAEMQRRIDNHRRERGDEFVTVEEPFELAAALEALAGRAEVAVVDCLTVWLGNLMHRHGADGAEEYPEITRLLALLERPPLDLLLVSNEVGMGIVPHNALARSYRDRAGRLNQQAAARADQVIFMVSGIPLVVKGATE